jgi:hypothetical protein
MGGRSGGTAYHGFRMDVILPARRGIATGKLMECIRGHASEQVAMHVHGGKERVAVFSQPGLVEARGAKCSGAMLTNCFSCITRRTI